MVCVLTRRVKSCSFNNRGRAFLLALLLLHSAILKPNFNLRFVEFECGGHLHSARPGQVLVEVKLLLKFRELLGGEIGAYYVLLAMDSIFGDFNCFRGVSLNFHPVKRWRLFNVRLGVAVTVRRDLVLAERTIAVWFGFSICI